MCKRMLNSPNNHIAYYNVQVVTRDLIRRKTAGTKMSPSNKKVKLLRTNERSRTQHIFTEFHCLDLIKIYITNKSLNDGKIIYLQKYYI